jgi:hypothetical protein
VRALPDKLEELKRLFLIAAVKYGVLPLDDRRLERFNSDIGGRPVLVRGNTQIDVGEDAADADHLISPEERLRVAMALQQTVPGS